MTLKQAIQKYLDRRNIEINETIKRLEELGAPKVIVDNMRKNLTKFPGSTKFSKLMDSEVSRSVTISYKYFPKGFPKVSKATLKIFLAETILVFIPESDTLATYNAEYEVK